MYAYPKAKIKGAIIEFLLKILLVNDSGKTNIKNQKGKTPQLAIKKIFSVVK